MSANEVESPTLVRVPGGIEVTTETYRLTMGDDLAQLSRSPYAELFDSSGSCWVKLCLLASADTTGGPDESSEIAAVTVREAATAISIELTERSAAWESKVVTVNCTAETIEIFVTVTGSGTLADVSVFGGTATLPVGASGTFRSGIGFQSLLVPSPTEPVQFVRAPDSPAVLGVIGDADPGRLNGIFSPPPLVFGFGRSQPQGPAELPTGEWLGLSVRGAVDTLTFTAVRYDPLDGGFLLRLAYEAHTTVKDQWTSPVFVFRTALQGWDVIEHHREDLITHGFAPESNDAVAVPAWWREPIFCGWGVQCARQAALARDSSAGNIVPSAPDLATQANYDEFLAVLATNDLRPGTIVVDDRWQAEYGSAAPDETRWPDLRSWIAARHAEGTRVLLWWKAWDPAGIPTAECVVDHFGRPVSVDPANEHYLARLSSIVAGLLGADGLDADGFKIDFTQRAPSGQTLHSEAGVWGIAALHRLLDTMYRAAKVEKPDALIVTHAIHPSFGGVSDMIRMNDLLERDTTGRLVSVSSQLRFRTAIARAALPDHLIDTDQWPMPTRAEWLDYVDLQGTLGVPALYYLESMDAPGQLISPDDLARVARSWHTYREGLPS